MIPTYAHTVNYSLYFAYLKSYTNEKVGSIYILL